MREVKVYGEYPIFDKNFKIYGTSENPLFLAKDIAEWIDYAYKDKEKSRRNVNMMLKGVDDEEKIQMSLLQDGDIQKRDLWFLTENGLYEVLMQSRKPIAKQFKKEVKKILKQIRMTGGAVVEGREEEFIEKYFPSFNKETKLVMVKDLYEQNKHYKQIIEEQKPMVEFADRVSNSSDLIDMGKMAKLLNDEDIPIGRNRLFEYLRKKKILMTGNTPYQKYIDDGYFKLKERVVSTPYGEKTYTTTYVTGRGQIYITEKLREQYKSQKQEI